ALRGDLLVGARRIRTVARRHPRRVLAGGGVGLRLGVDDREQLGAALRRFKKLVERSGMKGEIRAHEYYEKPCEARSRKEAKRKSTIRKAAAGTLKKPKPF